MANTSGSKKATAVDWHKADIKAALEKKGYSLSKLSREHGYCRTVAAIALSKPWPRMEKIIADLLGIEPWIIWPSRYNSDGCSNRPIGRPRLVHRHNSMGAPGRNGKVTEGF